MNRSAQRGKRGSTMLEFALLAPVFAAILVGLTSASMTFVRTLQADELCRRAAQMASAGSDFELDQTKDQIYNLYGGSALQNRQGVLYLTHIVRDQGGYRQDKAYSIGHVSRWQQSQNAAPELGQVVQLEPGEDAWVAEIWLDNSGMLSSVTPQDVHARLVL